MGLPRPLLEIDVRHGFYANWACPGLRFVPTLATRASIARAGGAVRAGARGIELWLADEAVDDWRGADSDDALVWLLKFDDANLADYTADLGRPRQELSYFDAEDAVFDTPTGYWRLNALHAASVLDIRSIAAARADAALDAAELRGNPCALVRVPVRALASSPDPLARYVIRFAPRETVWKYCFVGDWPEPALQVVDPSRQVTFEPAPVHALADGREALAFRSIGPVALQQLPRERFQLHSRGGDSRDEGRARPEKIIVKRLPAAAPRHFSREVIDGVPALVSEIFVHR